MEPTPVSQDWAILPSGGNEEPSTSKQDPCLTSSSAGQGVEPPFDTAYPSVVYLQLVSKPGDEDTRNYGNLPMSVHVSKPTSAEVG